MKSSKLAAAEQQNHRSYKTMATKSDRSHKKKTRHSDQRQFPFLWLQKNASGRSFTVWLIPDQPDEQEESSLWLRLNEIGKNFIDWVRSLFKQHRKLR